MKSLSQRSEELDEKLERSPVTQSIETLVQGAKRMKRAIVFLTISLIFEGILTVGLLFVALNAQHAAQLARDSKAGLVASCEAGNDFRASEKALWTYLLSLPTPNNVDTSPEEKARQEKVRADFKKYLDDNLAPRNCNNITQK